jgi:ubiquinone/menaquinone biosynthesis C-methylase UbiE
MTRVLASLAVFSLLLPPHPADPAQQKPQLFEPLDLGLLEAPDRDQWQKPDQIMDALAIADGSVVADLGAGSGWFTIRLARRVGPLGRVYAEDIQPQMIDVIKSRVQRENLSNVLTVLGTAADPRLPGGLDAVLIVDTFHEMQFDAKGVRRDPVELLSIVARSLKPQGRLGVVDFTPGGGGPGPAPDQRAKAEDVIRTATAAGLRVVRQEDIPPFVYLLVLARAEAAANGGR